jgi:hypothetical protein
LVLAFRLTGDPRPKWAYTSGLRAPGSANFKAILCLHAARQSGALPTRLPRHAARVLSPRSRGCVSTACVVDVVGARQGGRLAHSLFRQGTIPRAPRAAPLSPGASQAPTRRSQRQQVGVVQLGSHQPHQVVQRRHGEKHPLPASYEVPAVNQSSLRSNVVYTSMLGNTGVWRPLRRAR